MYKLYLWWLKRCHLAEAKIVIITMQGFIISTFDNLPETI